MSDENPPGEVPMSRSLNDIIDEEEKAKLPAVESLSRGAGPSQSVVSLDSGLAGNVQLTLSQASGSDGKIIEQAWLNVAQWRHRVT